MKHIYSTDNYVVFVPNYLVWHYAYKGKCTSDDVVQMYADMARVIISRNKDTSIIMLPQTFEYGTFEGDDIHLFRLIAEKVNDKRVIVLPDCYSSDVQQRIISKAKYVVGARYHSIVFAINQNVPFVSLSYEHKMSGLLETLGDQGSMIDFTQVLETEANRIACVEELSIRLSSIKLRPSLHIRAKKIANECFEDFLKKISLIYNK